MCFYFFVYKNCNFNYVSSYLGCLYMYIYIFPFIKIVMPAIQAVGQAGYIYIFLFFFHKNCSAKKKQNKRNLYQWLVKQIMYI